MTITALPPIPSRNDTPDNFISKVDAFLAALPTLQAEINAAALAMNFAATNGTSTTWVVMAIGAISLTTQVSKSYVVGMTVQIASSANGAVWMIGTVTAYDFITGALSVTTTDMAGSGTLASWVISQAAMPAIKTTDLQNQVYTGFVASGTAPTFVAATVPTFTVYASNQRFRIHFNASLSYVQATLNLNGIGAKSIKQYNEIGVKVDPAIAGQLCDIEYDGTDFVILNPLAPFSPRSIIRQTVQAGPVDANGAAAFVGATGATTVTATGILIASAANGFSVVGQVDRVGTITNPSWTGLSTNGAIYLYLDIAANGTCTTGSTTLQPTYIAGGTPSVVNTQFTFDYTKMIGYVGNGTTAAQGYRVYVGEVTVAGGVVTAIVWYALNGKFYSPFTAISTNTVLSLNHNVGTDIVLSSAILKALVNMGRFVIGDKIQQWSTLTTSAGYLTQGNLPNCSRLAAAIKICDGYYYFDTVASYPVAVVATGNLQMQIIVLRGW